MKKRESERIAETLKGELEAGRWKAGERLPSVEELCRRFGVGAFAVRAAVRRLRDEGLLVLRQNVGIMAAQTVARIWKGRACFVSMGMNASYFPHMVWLRISHVLQEHGYDCTAVFLASSHDGSLDLDLLARQIANGVDVVIVYACHRQIVNRLDRLGVPYVVLYGFARDFPNACGVIRDDYSRCFCDFIAALRGKGIGNVLEFDFERSMDRGFKAQLSAAGISVRRVLCKFDNDSPYSLSAVRAMGYRAVVRFFADEHNRLKPPEVVLFDDDYLASGGVVALLETGLRVPDDIKVVLYSNKGNNPVPCISAARIENDPVAYGNAVAEYVLKLLSGRRAALPKIAWRFVSGGGL